MEKFVIKSEFNPAGDQIKAIKSMVKGVQSGVKAQTLLGVTGSGKTYTMANVIDKTQRPTLVIAHNKTLAAQLCSEFKEFFPDNIVEYFVSYYDYYQPEAYIPNTDTYIEKDSSINEEIDKFRHSATAALFERRDVIIVASVSCIYGLGDPDDYTKLMLSLRPGMIKDRDDVIRKLIEIQYERNDIDFKRGKFRVKGDVLDIFPANTSEKIIRVEFFGDEIEKITEVEPLTGVVIGKREHVAIFPASHYATTSEKMKNALSSIQEELRLRLVELKQEGKELEAQRLEQRTMYDIEMLQEVGFCQGIENYSRHISGRAPGSSPFTLMDYFPEDYLVIIDESHVTIPQIGAMYNGDRSRKESLVDYGFRLPSAFDNRPLKFNEFEKRINQIMYVSATPGKYEKENSPKFIEQIIRPTGLIDPNIEVYPVEGQIDHLIGQIKEVTSKNYRTLVTTLTKKMAEDLTDYLSEIDMKVKYLHSDIDTIERMQIIRELRLGVFDVLIGINLLREGLDLPEVAFVAILDADKEGFLRSETSLIQTIGRAARNFESKVIMYADVITPSMQRAISETNRRRTIQEEHNKKFGITPVSIKKSVRQVLDPVKEEEVRNLDLVAEGKSEYKVKQDEDINVFDKKQIQKQIKQLTTEMTKQSKALEFEKAAAIRDKIQRLKEKL